MSKRIVTLDDLKKDPTMSQIIDSLTKKINGQLPPVIVDSLIDTATWSEVIPKQVTQWVQDTASIIDRISKETANSSDFSVCWIRIYEILDSLPGYFSRYEALFREKDKIADTAMKIHIELGENIRILINKLLANLSEDELIVLEYERNCNAHVFQSGYRVQVKIDKDAKIKKAKTEYKGKSIKDVNEIITRELIKHNHLDADFLKSILKKIRPQLNEIAAKIGTWSK